MALAEVESNVWINPDKINILRHDPDWGSMKNAPVQIILDGGAHTCRMETTMEQVCAAIDKALASRRPWWERIVDDAAEAATHSEK